MKTITISNYGYSFHSEQTELIIQVLVTSIFDSIVEIKFENLLEWQIKVINFSELSVMQSSYALNLVQGAVYNILVS